MPIPPLTVGLPVYNGERFVAHALDSILAQTFTDFRLIISDNASTDSTEDICREYAANDSRVDFVRHDRNRGAAWNFNSVVALCDSPYFRWAAADDAFAPTCFERCSELMATATGRIALCYPRTLVIDETGAVVGPYDDGLDLRLPRPSARIGRIVRRMVQGNPIFGLVKTDVLRSTRGHGSFPGADWVLMLEIALAGEVWEVPERLFLRRRHAGISRTENTTVEEYTRFLDPDATPVTHERLRLLREYLAGVRHADLPRLERAACRVTVAAAWSRRYGSVRRPLRRMQAATHRRLTGG
jgi:glycosyltransferase involved in cell wall biosynthesis